MKLPRRAVVVAASMAVFYLPGDARLDIDPGRLLADVTALSAPDMEGRLTGSPGNHRAQAFILTRFRQLALLPVSARYEQPFSFDRHPDATNLVATVRGTALPDDFLLVGAHYDHLGVKNGKTYPGADDNASGVAAMLQVAAWVAAHPLRRSVVFVAFDGEEEGLKGARYFVAHPLVDLRRVRLMINLDMLSRSDTGTIVASGSSFDPTLRDLVTKAAAGRTLTVTFGHDRPMYLAGGVEDWTQSSDQGPFHDAGVRTLYFGVEDHADYHHPTDTADKIPRTFFAEVTQLVLTTLRLADAG